MALMEIIRGLMRNQLLCKILTVILLYIIQGHCYFMTKTYMKKTIQNLIKDLFINMILYTQRL